jgi:hypothetical protein
VALKQEREEEVLPREKPNIAPFKGHNIREYQE